MLFIVISFLVGLMSSYYLAIIHSRQLLMVIYHAPFRFWRPYLALYDGLENKYTYELLGGSKRFKSHQSFLAEYQALRPHATERFRSLWNAYAKQVGRDYGLVLLVALGLFWSVFWAFVIPFLAIHLVAFFRLHFVQNYRADFFATLHVSLMLSEQRKAL
jgi:hypothetical protein